MCSTETSKITLKIWVWGEILRSNGYSANSWFGGRCPRQGVGIRASLGSLHTQTLLGFWDKSVCTIHRHRTMHKYRTSTKMLLLISLKINFKILNQPNLCFNSEVHGEKKEIHQLRVMHPAFPATAPWALPLEVPLTPSTSGKGFQQWRAWAACWGHIQLWDMGIHSLPHPLSCLELALQLQHQKKKITIYYIKIL